MALPQPDRAFAKNQKLRINTSTPFTDGAGTAYDPTTVLLKVQTPAGASITYTYGVTAGFIKDSVGTYHLDLTGDQSGVWYYEWSSNDGAFDLRAFEVRDSPF